MKQILLAGFASALMLTACKKDETVAEKSLDQQKIEFQQRQLEIERQKLAIEKEKMAYEVQKKNDSIAKVEADRQQSKAIANTRPRVIRETKTVYVNNTPRTSRSSSRSTTSSGTYANNSGTYSGNTQAAPQKKGLSHSAKGAIVGVATGAATGAIINKKNRGAGAVIGGIVGAATGYTIGRSVDKKTGRVP